MFLFGAFSTKAQFVEVADSLAAAQNYELAAIFYEKAIFNTNATDEYNEYLWKQADLYRAIDDFEGNVKSLERVNKSILTDHKRKELFYQMSFAYFMLEQYSKSNFNWLQYENIDSQSANEDALLLKTLLHAKMGKWDQSQEAYEAYSGDSSLVSQSVFSEIRSLKTKSVEKAENLSYFLPGAGQIYAGKPLRGITSFALQSGLLAFAAYNVLNGYYFSGTFTGVSLFYVFYMGGARHAGYLAEEYNIEQSGKAYNLLLGLINENEKGR